MVSVRYVSRKSNVPSRNGDVYRRAPKKVIECSNCIKTHSFGHESSGYVIRYGEIAEHSVERPEYLDIDLCEVHQHLSRDADVTYD